MKKVNLELLGDNIRLARLKLKYTQEDLENLTGILAQHIGRIERGEIDIRFSTLVTLLKALKISFEKIYDIEN